MGLHTPTPTELKLWQATVLHTILCGRSSTSWVPGRLKGHPHLDCPCTRSSLSSSSLCLAKVNTTSGPTQRSFSQWPLDSQNRFSLLFLFLQTPYSVYHHVHTLMPIPLMSFSSSRLFGRSQVVHISRTSSNWTREGFLEVT